MEPAMEKLLSTREVAEFLGVNEKMIYTLINEKGLPASKITGKWLFPKNLVDQWVASRTINYPRQPETAVEIPNLLLIAGSNDILLDHALALFRRQNPEFVAFFGNLGSLGGLKALRQGLCHVATSHLAQEDNEDYNFSFAASLLEESPAIVNFCHREQGLLVAKGNPLNVRNIEDIGTKGLSIVNRPLEASTRLMLDREFKKAGLDCRAVQGYDREFQNHLEVGLEVLAGRADTGPAIRTVADLLGLDFIPLRWERFDLLIPKRSFFTKSAQLFLELLHSTGFTALAENLSGYDLSQSGKMVYPKDA
jgi:excisionase family DNA binding protein